MHSLSVQPQYGRRQVLYKMWDAETYPFMRTTKSTFLTYMTLAREPKTQIAGITLLGDMQEMTRKHAPGNWTEVKMYASFMRVGIQHKLGVGHLHKCKSFPHIIRSSSKLMI